MDSTIGSGKANSVAAVATGMARHSALSASRGGSFASLDAPEKRRVDNVASRLDAAAPCTEAGAGAADAGVGQGVNRTANLAAELALGGGAGVTREQLEARLEKMESSNSRRYAWLSAVLANFDVADVNGDGRVSIREVHAIRKAFRDDIDRAAAFLPGNMATAVPLVTPGDGVAARVRQMQAYDDTARDEGSMGLSMTT